MKQSEIKVGGIYVAKVNGKLTRVRVDSIRKQGEVRWFGGRASGRSSDAYGVTNLATGRKTVFRSAAKFRAPEGADCEGSRKVKGPTPRIWHVRVETQDHGHFTACVEALTELAAKQQAIKQVIEKAPGARPMSTWIIEPGKTSPKATYEEFVQKIEACGDDELAAASIKLEHVAHAERWVETN